MSRQLFTEKVYGSGERALSKSVQARKIVKNFVILEIACFHSRCEGVIVKSHIRRLLSCLKRRLLETFKFVFLQKIFELSVTALTSNYY
jgi:hypothetical protein